MATHKIPDYNIYIGTSFALHGQKALADAGVTHILSALRGNIDSKLVSSFKHMHIQVDDDDDEDMLQYFDQSNAFIDEALSSGGTILVHCIAGISRSATLVIAYIMQDRRISFEEAWSLVQEGRPIVNPNDSFKEQLAIYEQDEFDVSASSPGYRRWKLKKAAELATASGTAPLPTIYSEEKAAGNSTVELRCKKCRCPLAQSSAIIPHLPPSASSRYDAGYKSKIGPSMVSVLAPSCMHYFLDPVRWMQPELENGDLDGKFDCPKCKTKIGSYRWQGMKCTCGAWVTPGISIQRGRVDEIRLFTAKA
ncbi:protein-tyrosine phosphatase-like protein [Lipomyces tetrasporus]